MNKTERLKEATRIILEADVVDLRGLPVKEGAANLGLGVLLVLIVALNLALSMWQCAVSLLIFGYDLTAKGLAKFMGKVKIPAQNAKG